jgi:hypothetical protein
MSVYVDWLVSSLGMLRPICCQALIPGFRHES